MSVTYKIDQGDARAAGHRIGVQTHLLYGDQPLEVSREPWVSAPVGSRYLYAVAPGEVWIKEDALLWRKVANLDDLPHLLGDHLDTALDAPSDGMRVAWDAAQQLWIPKKSTSALGIVEFGYRFGTSTDGTPGEGRIQLDNADPSVATVVHIHEIDGEGDDLTLFLENLDAGMWLNIHDNDDTDRYYLYDVTDAAVKVGDVFAVPVAFYEQAGASLTNNLKINLFIRYVPGTGLEGEGTVNHLAMWTPDGEQLGDSVLVQSGTHLSAGGTVSGSDAVDPTDFVTLQQLDAALPLLLERLSELEGLIAQVI